MLPCAPISGATSFQLQDAQPATTLAVLMVLQLSVELHQGFELLQTEP